MTIRLEKLPTKNILKQKLLTLISELHKENHQFNNMHKYVLSEKDAELLDPEGGSSIIKALEAAKITEVIILCKSSGKLNPKSANFIRAFQGSSITTIDLSGNFYNLPNDDDMQILIDMMTAFRDTNVTEVKLGHNRFNNGRSSFLQKALAALKGSKVKKVDLSDNNLLAQTGDELKQMILAFNGTDVCEIDLSSNHCWREDIDGLIQMISALKSTSITKVILKDCIRNIWVLQDRLVHLINAFKDSPVTHLDFGNNNLAEARTEALVAMFKEFGETNITSIELESNKLWLNEPLTKAIAALKHTKVSMVNLQMNPFHGNISAVELINAFAGTPVQKLHFRIQQLDNIDLLQKMFGAINTTAIKSFVLSTEESGLFTPIKRIPATADVGNETSYKLYLEPNDLTENSDVSLSHFLINLPAYVEIYGMNERRLPVAAYLLLRQFNTLLSENNFIFEHIQLPKSYLDNENRLQGLIAYMQEQDAPLYKIISVLLQTGDIPCYRKEYAAKKVYTLREQVNTHAKAIQTLLQLTTNKELVPIIRTILALFESKFLYDDRSCLRANKDSKLTRQFTPYLQKVCDTVNASLLATRNDCYFTRRNWGVGNFELPTKDGQLNFSAIPEFNFVRPTRRKHRHN